MRAVDDVTLGIAPGEVFGIAGPNGAGKSTLLGLLLGFLHPTEGAVAIAGMPPRTYVERFGVSYLPELMALPMSWTVESALRRLAILAGVAAGRVEPEVGRVIDALGIGEPRAKRLKTLSKGSFQRLGLAQVLLRDDDVIVLDEPTHGLDPVWTQKFRDIVRGLRRSDRTILIASHNLDELERLADRVAIIDQGRIQRVVTVGAAAGGVMAYRVRIAANPDAVLAGFPGSVISGSGEAEIPPLDLVALNAGLAASIAGGALISAVAPNESDLERAFHSAVGGEP